MPTLVIGGTGFIGPRLIKRLLAAGETVTCMDVNLGTGPFTSLSDKVRVIRGDVTHFEDVMRAVLEVKPDRLINLAYGIGAGEGNPHQVFRLDVLGMDNCFEAARLGGVTRVVYASSLAVSGQQSHFGERLVTEDDPLHGTSQYAVHKIFNEFQARKYVKNYGIFRCPDYSGQVGYAMSYINGGPMGASDGAVNGAVGVGPPRKFTSTLPTLPPPNSR